MDECDLWRMNSGGCGRFLGRRVEYKILPAYSYGQLHDDGLQ
jgi:hypothetical protein